MEDDAGSTDLMEGIGGISQDRLGDGPNADGARSAENLELQTGEIVPDQVGEALNSVDPVGL
jgi:hypothetical protein